MMVIMLFTVVFTKGIPYSFVIQNLMDDPFLQKCFQRSINGNPIEPVLELIFNISVRQRNFLIQESNQHILSTGRAS